MRVSRKRKGTASAESALLLGGVCKSVLPRVVDGVVNDKEAAVVGVFAMNSQFWFAN